MPLRCVVPALAAVVLLCAAPSAVAHPREHHRHHHHGAPVVAPIDRLAGLTGPEVLVRSEARWYEVPGPTRPDACRSCPGRWS